ncbi:hypothetical protein JCM1840_002568 [Sporobolomyces johnsonii]
MLSDRAPGDAVASADSASAAPRLRSLPTPPQSPAPSSSPLTSLPTEIICTILDHLAPYPASLAACCVLSRSFTPIARARLYSVLVLRTHPYGQALPSTASSLLDERSAQILDVLTTSTWKNPRTQLANLPTKLDFDLLSHCSSAEIGEVLAQIFATCPAISELRLGRGDHGHGIGYGGLARAIQLRGEDQAPRLTVLNLEKCMGSAHTLAALLVRLPHLQALRLGQFLLGEADLPPSASDATKPVMPTFRLHTFVARHRLTCLAFTFCTANSASTLRTVDLPICERNALDLSACPSLSSVTLFLFLSTAASQPSQTSYFSNKRTSTTASSPAAAAAPSLAKLAHNLSLTLSSSPYLSHLTLRGAWDTSEGALDLVRFGNLLDCLPDSLEALAIRTELNSIAVVDWLEGIGKGKGKGGAGRLKRLQMWQKQTYAVVKREFQRGVRERVDLVAAQKGVTCEWFMYEKW